MDHACHSFTLLQKEEATLGLHNIRETPPAKIQCCELPKASGACQHVILSHVLVLIYLESEITFLRVASFVPLPQVYSHKKWLLGSSHE